MSMTYQARETLRRELISEQLDKSEQGFEMILDGSITADLHIMNALNIVTDTHQGEALAKILVKMYDARLAMWSALGIANSDVMRG